MKIHQIYTDSALRNFNYIIALDNDSALVVDPWDADVINEFLQQHKLKLHAIINTHEHWDHTQGNAELVSKHGCEVWAHANGVGKIAGLSRILTAGEKIDLQANVFLQVLDTPGHSQAHLCFVLYNKDKATHIFSGDILFNAGVGNCHNGSVEDMYATIVEQFATLPDAIVILPGHDYLVNNLNFTLSREPSNQHAHLWLEKYQQTDIYTQPLTTTLADERQINTFFRLQNTEIIGHLPDQPQTDKHVFMALRKLRDNW